MGGKSAPAPQPVDPMTQANAQIAIDNASAARAEQAAAAERQRQADAKAAQIAKTAGQVSSYYSQGQNYGLTHQSNLGYKDTYGLLDAYNSALGYARNAVPEDASNVGSYFDYDTMWNKAVNDAQTREAGKLDTAYRGATKTGWENNYFADTADDEILNAILGEQYGTSKSTIDAAKARGQISEGAYNNAISGLDTRKTAALSELQDIGGGVLSKYRGNLDDIAKGYNDQITNYKLGNQVSIDDMLAAFGTKTGELTGRMQGDIRNALGDTALFNTDSIIAKGNSGAGAQNNPLLSAFKDATSDDPTRTTGTTGVF
jgi:hypothetical protein